MHFFEFQLESDGQKEIELEPLAKVIQKYENNYQEVFIVMPSTTHCLEIYGVYNPQSAESGD